MEGGCGGEEGDILVRICVEIEGVEPPAEWVGDPAREGTIVVASDVAYTFRAPAGGVGTAMSHRSSVGRAAVL